MREGGKEGVREEVEGGREREEVMQDAGERMKMERNRHMGKRK